MPTEIVGRGFGGGEPQRLDERVIQEEVGRQDHQRRHPRQKIIERFKNIPLKLNERKT